MMHCPELDKPLAATQSVISQPGNKCGLCGRAKTCHDHYLKMFMARKSMIMPGPAGITYQAEVRKITVNYRVCEECEKHHAEMESANLRDPRVWISGCVCYLIIGVCILGGVLLGWRWYSLLMIIPGGMIGGWTRMLFDWLLGVKKAPPLYEGHQFVMALANAGWSVGAGPSRFDIKSLPEHWPDEQREIDAKRKAEHIAIKEALRPKTTTDRIAMWLCIFVFLAIMIGFIYVVTNF